ncbi:MAG: hypothetical protein HOK98_16500 [Rhodospirillaceae bacterium]|jgi:hypothetical protein|nr:hypothetical protein [Rhodospirillaceae bacterium]MBT6404786.1 hypothetical protein [Rhodospirillaceae bacterium]MBT6537774.1 hypothetical protein [Rhodospirillaceae bacterium]MBT7362404.1 hypothetical protein [Rhodospirillaceae bacterium]
MWLLKHRIAAVAVALLLAACTSGNEGLTVGGARTVFSDPIVVDIVDARFNIPSLLPEVDRVRRTLRDNGSVVVETYYIGDAPIIVVEHASEAWFSDLTLANAIDETAFRDFLGRTVMAAGKPVISKVPRGQGRGFVATDGDCIAFHFFKRIKGTTGFDNDTQNPDTFIVGFTCGDNAASFVGRFGFMSPAEATRIGRRHSI